MVKALLADLDIRVQAVVELVTLCSRKKNHSDHSTLLKYMVTGKVYENPGKFHKITH